jgi:hypothetical protein
VIETQSMKEIAKVSLPAKPNVFLRAFSADGRYLLARLRFSGKPDRFARVDTQTWRLE